MPRRKDLTIRVTIRTKDNKQYLRHRHPLTGKEQLRPVRGKYPSEWEREAGAWERELQDEADRAESNKRAVIAAVKHLTWVEFRTRFTNEHLLSLAESTDSRFQTVLNAVEEFGPPKLVNDIDASYVSRFHAFMRNRKIAESTLVTTLNHFRVALNWGKSIDVIETVPKFPAVIRARKGQRRKPMKGRPPSLVEFGQILAAVPECVPAAAVEPWRRFLRALWWGGLRLEEALELHWDRLDKMRVDLDTQKHPVLRILSTTEKGKKDRVYPIAPEFAELLRETPIKSRRGLVFPLKFKRKTSKDEKRSPGQIGVTYASAKIIQFGAAAKVVTHVNARTRQSHYAGAHDFRRAFGTRWARLVKPLILKEMMRHESLETTMDYYVELDTEETADGIWAAWNAVQGAANNSPVTPPLRGPDGQPGKGNPP